MNVKCFTRALFFLVCGCFSYLSASHNQTSTVSPIFSDDKLPFQIEISLADFSLPNGIHSGAYATYDGQWLYLAGRTNGMHTFDTGTNNFPPSQQNTTVYVINPATGSVITRSLTDPLSGLTQQQIDSLSVTSPQSYSNGSTLYITGGYGVDSATGLFSTKDTLTAISIPGLIHWVTEATIDETAVRYIRQIQNPIFQITGGYMDQIGSECTLLVFGQNFKGFYEDNSNGDYSRQVRRFKILDDGYNLGVKILNSKPKHPNPNYRRRDLNVVPTVRKKGDRLISELIAYSGVFTPSTGIWTIPVVISDKGTPSTFNPLEKLTFKQGMNNYACPTLGLFSERSGDMYTLFFGGISYGFFTNGVFATDTEFPFINQVTTVKRNRHKLFTQYLMSAQYPAILSTGSRVANPLLFGAGGSFFLANGIPAFSNEVVQLDSLGKSPTVIGYILAGIQSSQPNTESASDSTASPFVFQVTLIKK